MPATRNPQVDGRVPVVRGRVWRTRRPGRTAPLDASQHARDVASLGLTWDRCRSSRSTPR